METLGCAKMLMVEATMEKGPNTESSRNGKGNNENEKSRT